MKNKKTITIFIIGALGVAMAFGAVAYRSVLAATPTITSPSTTIQVESDREAGRGPRGGYSSEDLANALGITVDELNTANEEAYSAALADAVSQGLITQDQADELTTDGDSLPFGKLWKGWLSQNGIDLNAYLADALGISIDDLMTAKQTANFSNIDQAVTDGELTQEQADLMKGQYALSNDSTFQSSMKSAYTAAVNQAVSSGVITQAQADQILSKSDNLFMNGMGAWGSHGDHRGHGGEGLNGSIPSDEP
jgi:hypothetical protein